MDPPTGSLELELRSLNRSAFRSGNLDDQKPSRDQLGGLLACFFFFMTRSIVSKKKKGGGEIYVCMYGGCAIIVVVRVTLTRSSFDWIREIGRAHV